MKKLLSMILILVMVVGLVGCSKEPVGDSPTVNGQDYFNASVIQVNDTFILAEVTENVSGALAVGTEVSVSRNNISSEEFPELVVGDYIRVVYAGEVLEKDPPGFQQIISVFKLNEEGAVLENADEEKVTVPAVEDEGFPNWGLTLSVENASNIITNVAHLAPEAIWGYSVMSLPSINKALYDRISVSDFRRRSWLDPDLTWSPGTENYTPSNGYQFAGTDDPLSGYEEVGFTTAHDYFLYWTAPYVNIKFRPANGQCVEYTEGNCADHVLMRVEEMYFIEIEAVLRTKGLAEAQKLLNSFMKTYRDRSYDCSYATSDLSFIQEMLLQKRIEFWGEGILFYDYKRLDQGITRGYSGTNFPAVARFNTEGRSPQWNLVITRGEYQSNTAINDGNNNPDSTELLVPWTE